MIKIGRKLNVKFSDVQRVVLQELPRNFPLLDVETGRKRQASAVLSPSMNQKMMASHRWEAACCLSRRELRGAVPGQEVIDPVDRMIGDVGQHMAQPRFGVNPVQLGSADQ